MANSQSGNQIDPFADKEDFNTKGIRNTQSHSSKNPFVNIINPADEKARKRNRAILIVLLIAIVVTVSAIFVIPLLSKPVTPVEPEEEIVNPTGRKSAIDDAPAFDDPETRKGEQQKLDAVFVLMEENDWEYINALFETIFPDYLDDCGKYDYYRAAAIIADNFEAFAIPKDVAISRAEALLEKCDRTSQDTKTPEE